MTLQPYANAKSVDTTLIDLLNDVQKAVPTVMFKQGEIHTRHRHDNCDPEGLTVSFDVFLSDSPDTRIAVIGKNAYSEKFFIVNRNIVSARRYWGRGEGSIKESKTAKNILTIAKKTIKPLSIIQTSEDCKGSFEAAIAKVRSKYGYELNSKTGGTYDTNYLDMLNLHKMGYVPVSEKFAKTMAFFVENQENIDKYRGYNPQYCFVWIKPDKVEYVYRGSDPQEVASLNGLPQDIRDKMFVLDITEEQSFVEDIGLKESKNRYWVLV